MGISSIELYIGRGVNFHVFVDDASTKNTLRVPRLNYCESQCVLKLNYEMGIKDPTLNPGGYHPTWHTWLQAEFTVFGKGSRIWQSTTHDARLKTCRIPNPNHSQIRDWSSFFKYIYYIYICIVDGFSMIIDRQTINCEQRSRMWQGVWSSRCQMLSLMRRFFCPVVIWGFPKIWVPP